MAKKLSVEDDIIDLTELIETGNAGDKRVAGAYAKAAAMADDQDDDFEAVLAQQTVASRKVDPDESLDMSEMGGIDNLLDSLDIPNQPREKAAPARREPDDLDNALDDLLGPDEGASKGSSSEADLDSLLEDLPGSEDTVQSAPPPEKEPPLPKPSHADIDSDLDDILSSFDSPATPEAPAAPQEETETELTADLDDILNDVPPPPEPEPVMDMEKLTPPVEQLPPEEIEPSAQEDEEQEPIAEAEDVPEPPLQESTPAPKLHEPELEDPEARVPATHAAASIWSPEAVASICHNLALSQDGATQQSLQGFARELGEQSAHIEDMGARLELLSKRIIACESRLSAARVKMNSLEKAIESTAAIDDLLREGTPLHSGFMGLIAAAVSSALQNFSFATPAPDPDLLNRIDSLAVRLAETSGRVSELEKRIDAEEKQTGSSEMEDMGKLINGLENTDARLTSLERRLVDMDSQISEKLEKTAAATAARVLQEEIAKLIQDGNGI